MKLYTLAGASSVTTADGDMFSVDDDGTIEVPESLGTQLARTHVAGVKVWETEAERQVRLQAEKDARDADPKTLLAEVKALRADLTSTV